MHSPQEDICTLASSDWPGREGPQYTVQGLHWNRCASIYVAQSFGTSENRTVFMTFHDSVSYLLSAGCVRQQCQGPRTVEIRCTWHRVLQFGAEALWRGLIQPVIRAFRRYTSRGLFSRFQAFSNGESGVVSCLPPSGSKGLKAAPKDSLSLLT